MDVNVLSSYYTIAANAYPFELHQKCLFFSTIICYLRVLYRTCLNDACLTGILLFILFTSFGEITRRLTIYSITPGVVYLDKTLALVQEKSSKQIKELST